MPTLYNPTDCRVPCYPLELFVNPGGRVRISDEQARLVAGSVLVVEPDPEPEPEARPDREERLKRSAPARKTTKRGSKRAEVTGAPERETRG